VLRMVKLRQDSTGKYIARKRLPEDVREEYGRRHKAHHEAKFSAPASDGPHIGQDFFPSAASWGRRKSKAGDAKCEINANLTLN
jgi:hypothetical protein